MKITKLTGMRATKTLEDCKANLDYIRSLLKQIEDLGGIVTAQDLKEKSTTSARVKETILSVAPVKSVNGQIGEVVLSKTDVGLGDVDNTSDANKPVSTATATALTLKLDKPLTDGLWIVKVEGVTTTWEILNISL